MNVPSSSYTAVAVALHWAIAAAILGNVLLGWWMAQAIEDADAQLRAITAFQLHKSIGLTVLALSLLRLGWRLLNPPPPLPAAIPAWQKRAALTTHWLFYLLMLGIPFTGWIMVSSQWRDGAALNVPTLWFGWFEVPHLFGLNESGITTRDIVARNAARSHEWLAWSAMGLLAMHVGAALKHHFIDRDRVLASMLPLMRRSEPVRSSVIAIGLISIALGAVASSVWVFQVPLGSVAFKHIDKPVFQESTARVQATTGKWAFKPGLGNVGFSALQSGDRFEGEFSRWRATLVFDPEQLGAASLQAEIETASANTGNSLYDEALPAAEWFNVKRYPLARFLSTKFTPRPEGDYLIVGVLTIKDFEMPVRLTLEFIEGGAAVNGSFEIDRFEANLGMESDPKAEYVSRLVEVTVRAKGRPIP